MQAPPARPVGSVARALALLDALAASDSGLGVSELGRRIGVNASTASRLLATLEQQGFVERDERGPHPARAEPRAATGSVAGAR
jgi:DNA-binding MarR family transcriptional regulator